jgi:hypothetical protein
VLFIHGLCFAIFHFLLDIIIARRLEIIPVRLRHCAEETRVQMVHFLGFLVVVVQNRVDAAALDVMDNRIPMRDIGHRTVLAEGFEGVLATRGREGGGQEVEIPAGRARMGTFWVDGAR